MSKPGYRFVLFVCLAFCVAVSIPTTLRAQAVNATVVGTVTDQSGAVVGNANVTSREVTTNASRTTTTNTSGNFVFANLPPGTYDVTAEAQGFSKATQSAIRVDVNSTVRADFTLQPGAVTQTVEVTGTAPLLQTDRADVGLKIDREIVTNLPQGGSHNFQGLINLVPGSTRAHREHSVFFNAQDSLRYEVNGQPGVFSGVQIEGVDDNERTGLLQIYIPPQEAIQTVDVTTSNYAAEFGRAGGALTNVQLKSGTNNFHGSAYEFNRISALQAKGYFDRPPAVIPRTTYNYYGGTIGGPIIHNKTFFFFDILRVADHRGFFSNFTVPTDAFRNGDFSSQSASGIKIYNPFTPGSKVDGTGRQQFSYQGQANVIDPALISPIARSILDKFIPHANVAGCPGPACPVTNNFAGNWHLFRTSTQFDFKLDHNFSTNDRIAFRFSRGVQDTTDQPIFGIAGGPNDSGGGAGFNGTGTQTQHSGAINETHIFSPTLVSEIRAGISHYRNVAVTTDHGKNAGDDLGIKGANLNDFTSGMPSISLGGFSDPLIGYSASLPWDRGETNLSIVNNWTKIRGNHTIKWGADIRRLRDDLVQAQAFSPRGRFRFDTNTTTVSGAKTNLANNFAAFLLDMPSQVGRDISFQSGSWRETELFLYGQDTWHITNKLTLDGGLRWEYYEPAHPHHPGGYSDYNPADNTLVVAGIGGNPIDLGRKTQWNLFAPRFGAVYRVTEATVVRAGFGISYQPFPDNNYAFNFPIRQNNSFDSGNSFGWAQLSSSDTTVVRMACPAGSPTPSGVSCFGGFPAPSPFAIPSNGIISAPAAGQPDPNKVASLLKNNTFNVVNKNFKEPYVESWNLAVEHALRGNWVADIAYVGNIGMQVPMTLNLNAAQAPSLNSNGTVQSNSCLQGNSTRPLCNAFGRIGDTNFLYKGTTSNYNSLQAKFDHKWAHGFGLTTAYTWAKGLAYRTDTGSTGGGANWQAVTGPFANFQRNYGLQNRIRRHTFVQTYVYELPFGKGKSWLHSGAGNWIAGGWTFSGDLSIQSGEPLDWSSTGNSLSMNGSRQVPIQIAPFHVLGGIDTANWFDTSAFCQPGVTDPTRPNCPVVANGVIGNMARYAYAGPKFFNLDGALMKKFNVTERVVVEVRAEAFGLTNTPQFSNPTANASDVNFGKVKSAGGNRSMQLAAKITF